MHRAGTMWGHREDTASTPRREVLGEPALRVPGPQNSSLQGWGRADLCGAIPQAVGLCCCQADGHSQGNSAGLPRGRGLGAAETAPLTGAEWMGKEGDYNAKCHFLLSET